MKKTTAIILCACLFLTVLSGCGQVPADTAAPSGCAIDCITVGTTAAIEKAIRGEYYYDMLASGVTELPLVYQDTNGDYHPLVADFSTEDGTTWVYTVTDGMTWDDGVGVTAEDILFTLQYDDANGEAIFEDKTDSDGNTTGAKYAGYQLSEDKMSISLTLAVPNVRELGNMTSFRVMPKHIYEGRDSVSDADARVGCGPYVFDSFNAQAGTVSFIARADAVRKPNAARIVYQIFGNDDTMYMALKNGDIDMVWNYSAGVPAGYAEVLGEGIALESVPAVNEPAVLVFNNAQGLFADERLRTAVSYALDYDMFKTYFGSASSVTPNRGFVPSTTLGYTETEKLAADPAKAAALMADAGYTAKNADGYYINSSGEPAAFTLSYNADKESHAGYAELVKTQLEAFGISVTLDGADKDSYNAKTSNKFSGNNITMEAAILACTSAGMGMGNGLGTIYVDGSHAVQGGCQVFDSEFTAALDAMSEAKTLDEYCAAAAAVQEYYAAHTPLIALYWDDQIYAYSSRFEGVTVDCTFGLNNVNNWYSIRLK